LPLFHVKHRPRARPGTIIILLPLDPAAQCFT